MNSSVSEAQAKAVQVSVTSETLKVELADGRTISVPTSWYPRLLHSSEKEWEHWRLIGGGEGIHWPDLDEDVSVDNLLAGRMSGESQASLKRWMAQRGA